MKRFLAAGFTGLLASAMTFAAFAQGGVKTEIATAHTHAKYAAEAPSVAVSHVHLHHVINCLVGPKGAAFDADQANPCKGQGNGALPDSAGNAALHAKLQTALKQAQAGLKSADLKTVHADAEKVAATLQDTPTQKASGGYSW